jgi:hypothetical protein
MARNLAPLRLLRKDEQDASCIFAEFADIAVNDVQRSPRYITAIDAMLSQVFSALSRADG